MTYEFMIAQHIHTSVVRRTAQFCTALLLLVSCGEELAQPTIRPVKPGVARTAADTGSASGAAPATEGVYAYNPVGKRDPFRSYLLELRARGSDEKRTPPKSTERFELDQYRLTGIMSGTSQPRALVEDPTGKGHALHIGSPLGKNKGRVTRISSTQVIVVEQFRNAKGELMRVPITIKLPQDELTLGENE